MKKVIWGLGFLLTVCAASYAHDPVRSSISFGAFYSSLAPHGEWISMDAGVYAWHPHSVEADWRPYTAGKWVWTDDGWYWASDEPWGWATYHYGRWYYDDNYGWVWIPGYDWAPAWVEWRYGGDYVGWAPLGPYALFDINFGIHYARHWLTPYHYWSFVDCRYISSPDIHRYVYRSENNTRYIGRTRSAGSVRYDGGRVVSRGPEREYIERRGNVRVERAEIVDVGDRTHDRINGNRIEVYRPKVDDRSNDRAAERPEHVRERERSISLDARDLDVRSRDRAREVGRDLRKAEEYREREQVQRRPERQLEPRGSEQRSAPQVRGERKDERKLEPSVRVPERRNDDRSQVRPERRVERLPEVQRKEPLRREPSVHPESNRGARPSAPSRTGGGEPRQGGRQGDSGRRR
jgi:hypothetical protein